MRFTFNVTVGDDVPCGPDIATVQSVTNQTLFCARTATNCSASTQTGSALLNLSIVRPSLNFTVFNATMQPIVGGITYTYAASMQNTGPAIAPGVPVLVTFYCDSDNSLDYSVGDNAVGTYTTTAGIGSNATHNFSGSFFIATGGCNLTNMVIALAVPDGQAGLCICDTASSNTNVILPVEWLSVTGVAQPRHNEVHWEVDLQPDHAYFGVEKWTDGGWVGISPRITDIGSAYAWADHSPGIVERYRIQESSQDGRVHYSPEVELVRDGFSESLRVYPNPSQGTVYLQAPVGTAYHIYNAIGQVMVAGAVRDNAAVEVDVTAMAAGVYLVEFRQADRIATMRLVVE